MNFEEFFVFAWTKEEYLDAISNDLFFDSVEGNLLASAIDDIVSVSSAKEIVPIIEIRKKLVESKYYYAGGCCRFMFRLATESLKTELQDLAHF